LIGGTLQRLFSNFANGWPGMGLLLQRILTAILLIRFGIVDPTGTSHSSSMILQIIGAGAGVLLLVGFCTPVAGALIAVIELWVAIAQLGDPWISVVLATFGATAAMIGPGAWSIDARLFGRKHLEA
jgi:putative oxidoreductase